MDILINTKCPVPAWTDCWWPMPARQILSPFRPCVDRLLDTIIPHEEIEVVPSLRGRIVELRIVPYPGGYRPVPAWTDCWGLTLVTEGAE